MTEKAAIRLTFGNRLLAILFVVTLTGLLIFNSISTVQLADLSQNQAQLQSKLEHEKNLNTQLDSLETKYKTVESEFQMMEQGLRKRYERYVGLENFIPVFDDQIVAYDSENEYGGSQAMFYVPNSGDHHLIIEAVNTTPQKNAIGNRLDDNVSYRKSFPIESGTNHVVTCKRHSGGISFSLDGQDGEVIECPVDRRSPGVGFFSNDRVVVSLNQVDAAVPNGIQRSEIFQMVIYASGLIVKSKCVVIRLFIESDGPMTSSADDPPVVRMLLKEIEAGRKPEFTFNPEGWYGFEDSQL